MPWLLYDVSEPLKKLRQNLAAMTCADYDIDEIIHDYVPYREEGESATHLYKKHGSSTLSDIPIEDGVLLHQEVIELYNAFDLTLNQGPEHIKNVKLTLDESALLVEPK